MNLDSMQQATVTYGAEGNSGSGEAYETAIACMRLVDGIGKVVAELVEDSLNPGVVLVGGELADHPLKSAAGLMIRSPDVYE